MLRTWIFGLAAFVLAASAAAAEEITKFTLPSGTKITVEVLGKAKNRSANRLVMYASVRVASSDMNEARANAVADEAFEYLLGGMAIASSCDAALVTVDRASGTPRPFTSYYATVTPLNFRVEAQGDPAGAGLQPYRPAHPPERQGRLRRSPVRRPGELQ
ncbi:MAG: hypothetical protein U1E87_02490 [Alphaproteobacteria bacterium]